jgi:hypothetical protein
MKHDLRYRGRGKKRALRRNIFLISEPSNDDRLPALPKFAGQAARATHLAATG